MVRWLKVLLLLTASLLTTAASAQATVVSFDEPDAPEAPCTFSEAKALTTEYEKTAGVVFSGGMEVLNACGNFGIVEHSGNRFLAWNTINAGTEPPETLTFSMPVSHFSLLTGSQVEGTVTATAYDSDGELLATKTLAMKPSAMRITLDAEGIAKVVIESTAQYGAIDDIRFVRPQTRAVPSPTPPGKDR